MNRVVILSFWILSLTIGVPVMAQELGVSDLTLTPEVKTFVNEYCVDCHDTATKTAGFDLEQLLKSKEGGQAKSWEAVVRKLATRQMPPADMPKPDEQKFTQVLSMLTSSLDETARRHPNSGRVETLRRLNRTEYHNAVRDLLDLEVDVNALLPADESSQGFDNITVTDLSPSLMNRYLSAAQKISRLAVGNLGEGAVSDMFRMRPDVTQDRQRVKGLPLGTRGGILIPYHFPQDGEYEIQIRLMRDRNDEIEGLRGKHELQVLIDRKLMTKFSIARPGQGKSDQQVDANLNPRIQVKAGRRNIGVTFVKKSSSLLESERQPLNVHYNFYRHPRLGPAVYQVSITGPFNPSGPGDTPSRQKIFVRRPTGPDDEKECAKEILNKLLRRAYRRSVTKSDLKSAMAFFERGSQDGGFEVGIERALASVLVNPNFLFRLERQPKTVTTGQPYQINDVELASRLSFFLWSSIPDEELLDVAIRGELSRPEILEQQVQRMLADERSNSLVTNFANQWLHLRNLDSFVPDARLYPDFGHNLREALKRETELLFQRMMREDQSVLSLIDSKTTFLNERLARHYGVPHVVGSHFREVQLGENSQRGGILRHGSILSVTSYATRTSPVIRGTWILENLLGSPPPPPPPNVPALEDSRISADLPVRERLAAHRANAACASCHDLIDPVGFGLENYDAIGRWREKEMGQEIVAEGGLPDGKNFSGVGELEQALLARPELFVQTMTEKLMVFGLGRGLEYYDAPAVRTIVRDASKSNFRFSSIIIGIVKSLPFQKRMPAAAD